MTTNSYNEDTKFNTEPPFAPDGWWQDEAWQNCPEPPPPPTDDDAPPMPQVAPDGTPQGYCELVEIPTHCDAFLPLDKQENVNPTVGATQCGRPQVSADPKREPTQGLPYETKVTPPEIPPVPPEIPPAPSDADLPPESIAARRYAHAMVRLDNRAVSAPDPYGKSAEYYRNCLHDRPVWVEYKKDDTCTVNDWLFASWFAAKYDIYCINYQFYMCDVKQPVSYLRRAIVDEIACFATVSSRKITAIVALIEDIATCTPTRIDPEVMYFENCSVCFIGKPLANAKKPPKTHTDFDALVGDEGENSPVPSPKPKATHCDAFLGVDNEKMEFPLINAHVQHYDLSTLGADEPNLSGAQIKAVELHKLQEIPRAPCRIPHAFDPTVGEPTRLLQFLSGLLSPDDMCALQEYLGYCLLPSTRLQKALFIVGKGGEGKSRITYLMQQVLGERCLVSTVGKINDRFFGTMLEDRLLFIDDDLQAAKFNATDTFKTLVTNECKVLVEPKGKPYYEIRPYARFLLMGNQSVGSLHDKTDGFYRRVRILTTKPAPKNRAANPTLIQEIWEAEKAEILLWLVKGALRLVRNNYRLTESAASRAALRALREEDNTALSFLKEQQFQYGEGLSVTSSQLVAKYREWCYDNDLFKVSGQSFKQTCDAFFETNGGRYKKNIETSLGRVRGYTNVCFTVGI